MDKSDDYSTPLVMGLPLEFDPSNTDVHRSNTITPQSVSLYKFDTRFSL